MCLLFDFFSPGNVLDSCDGRVVSNNNIYVDFGLIKYQCSCSLNVTFNNQLVHSLSRNPGFDDCGTSINIKETTGINIYRMPCTSSIPHAVVSSQSTKVELVCSDPQRCHNAGYCLLILSNGMNCLLSICYLT